MSQNCHFCGQSSADDANFCEHCGKPLTGSAAEPAPELVHSDKGRCSCNAGFDDSGFCNNCGRKQAVDALHPGSCQKSLSDHFAMISDTGRRHKDNEDAVDISTNDKMSFLVVCDGVSTAQLAAKAAMTAANAFIATLSHANDGGVDSVERAVAAAHAAVLELPWNKEGDLAEPMTTIVGAMVFGQVAHLSWVGDSRAYLIGSDNKSVLLTRDDSWLSDAIDGGMSEKEALKNPHAHEITQCLGMRDAPVVINTASVALDAGQWLILCSDGLWNYCPTAGELASLVKPDIDNAAMLAEKLCAHANSHGGRDNISVICLKT